MKMASSLSLVQFWRQLTETVHPDDAPVFAKGQHTFNLDYPPPAYIGNVDQAPVLILMGNGGYSPIRTPREFVQPKAKADYLNGLHNPGPVTNKLMSDYYTNQANYAKWLINGKMALVNAVAYRSPGISSEPHNERLAQQLPSLHTHRRWLIKEVLPQAKEGRRLVVMHRNGLWKLGSQFKGHPGLLWSTNPASPYLSKNIIEAIEKFISKVVATT